MQIHSVLIPVDNIDTAIIFYTENLCFKKKHDISKIDKKTGLEYRKVSLLSTRSDNNFELVFSTLSNSFEPLITYQKQLHKLGVPYLNLSVINVNQEYHRLLKSGVVFSLLPKVIGLQKIAVFDDGCGNNIQIIENL
tara:strand:- start:99 stop:509 length:411 start_codon:yes stop_codon:yes gene_type:complete